MLQVFLGNLYRLPDPVGGAKSAASFRNLLEVFKICYNSKNEKEIDLDLEDFELVGKQVRTMRDIRPEAKEPL